MPTCSDARAESAVFSAPLKIVAASKTFHQYLNTETFDAVTDKVYFEKHASTAAGVTHCNPAQPLLRPSHDITCVIAVLIAFWRSGTFAPKAVRPEIGCHRIYC